MWKIQQATNRDNVLQLYIYGDVEGGYWDWWSGEYVESDTSAEHFRQELAKYPNTSEIEIFINSYGGEVFEGTAIYNQLMRHPAHKTVYIDGFACSIASVIAMAGDEIVMPRNTLMMIHNAWMATFGNAAQLRKAADDLDVINAAGRQAYLQKAGDKLSEERLVEMMDAETWLTAADCIELGLADRFADEDADLSKAGEILQKVNLTFEQQVQRNKAIAARARELCEVQAAAAEEKADAPIKAAEDGGHEDEKSPENVATPGLMAILAGAHI
jgi:ATP-dependent protease ClpP protease subunit